MQIQYPLVSCVGLFLNWWAIKYRLKSHLERIWTHFLPDELWWLSSDLVCNMDLVLTSWAKWTQYSTVEHYGLSSHLVSYVNTPGEYKNSAFTWWALWTKHSPGELSWVCSHSHLLSYVGSVLTGWAILANFSPRELCWLSAHLVIYFGSVSTPVELHVCRLRTPQWSYEYVDLVLTWWAMWAAVSDTAV